MLYSSNPVYCTFIRLDLYIHVYGIITVSKESYIHVGTYLFVISYKRILKFFRQDLNNL